MSEQTRKDLEKALVAHLKDINVTPNGYEHEWCPNPTVKRFCEPSYPE